MALHTYALTTLESLKRFMGITDSDIQTPIFTLYNSSTDATEATYQVTSIAIILVVTGGVNAHAAQTFTFADADKDTITELVAAINTFGKGWVAEVVANGGQNSTDLTMIDATSCLLVDNKKILHAPNNLLLEELINSVTDFMERYCGRRFYKTTYTALLVDGNGTRYLFLDNYPIISVTTIHSYSVFTTDVLYDSNYYTIYANEGYVYRALGWPYGHKNIKITYDAGYDFAVGIPSELEYICNSLVSKRFNSEDKIGIKSEKIGGYSVTYSDESIPADIRIKLNQWRKLSVV